MIRKLKKCYYVITFLLQSNYEYNSPPDNNVECMPTHDQSPAVHKVILS